MTTTPTPNSRDRGIATVRRLTVGGALAGMTLTGALARADAAAEPVAAEQPESATSTAVAPAMPRRTVIIMSGDAAPAPVVRAPQQPAAPAARSTGSGPG